MENQGTSGMKELKFRGQMLSLTFNIDRASQGLHRTLVSKTSILLRLGSQVKINDAPSF